MFDFLKRKKNIIFIIFLILMIELSGYGILASLSRLISSF